MKPKDMLVELESAAQFFNVKVSYEPIASLVVRGGLCKVKGQYRVIIDKRLTLEERANTLAQSLAQFDGSELTIAPAAMSLLQYYTTRRMSLRQGPKTAAVVTADAGFPEESGALSL